MLLQYCVSWLAVCCRKPHLNWGARVKITKRNTQKPYETVENREKRENSKKKNPTGIGPTVSQYWPVLDYYRYILNLLHLNSSMHWFENLQERFGVIYNYLSEAIMVQRHFQHPYKPCKRFVRLFSLVYVFPDHIITLSYFVLWALLVFRLH